MTIKKVTLMLSSILFLPITSAVASCNNVKNIVNDQFDHEKDQQIDINNISVDKEELKQINTDFIKIKAALSTKPWDEEEKCKDDIKGNPYVCGSDFTTSQSLADITVNKKIIEKIVNKIKKLDQHNANPINLSNIRFIPELKSVLFKAGKKNYSVKNEVNLQVIYLKENFQTSITFPLEIKGVYQDLEELVNQAMDELKDKPTDFSKSFLLEDDDLQEEKIEQEFLRLIKLQVDQDDERIEIKLKKDEVQELKNDQKIKVEVIGKDDTDHISKQIEVELNGLKTVSEFLSELNTNISVQREDDLFANMTGESYINSMVSTKLSHLIKTANMERLKDRTIETFELNPSDIDVNLTKGKNDLSAKVKLEFNKTLADIDLSLLNVETHPQVILDEVANHFETASFDLSEAPIFTDSDFNLPSIQDYLLKLIKAYKQKANEDFDLDAKDDIAIKIDDVLPGTNDTKKVVSINADHKTIKTVNGKAIDAKNVNIDFINIQKSPQQHLKERLDDIFSSWSGGRLDRTEFNDIFVSNVDLPEFSDFEINTYIIPAVSRLFNNDTDRYITIELVSKKRPTRSDLSKLIEFKFTFTRNKVKAEETRQLEFYI